jgi:meso-butanediol dehydrogenase / (S,S)-butanediol dehydrogenase / diacetyl reductase
MGFLDGKVALVTGAGQGVGQGIAYALAGEGAWIAVAGRTLAKLEESCAEIRRRGGTAQPFLCDVTVKADLERLVEQVVSEFGGIQILVNNAQQVPLGPILSITDEAFLDGIESGPLASLRLMRACYPHLKGDGVVINLGTAASLRQDLAGYGAYAAVKEATRSLTRAAACEWGLDGIRVNCIIPLAMSKGMEGWIAARPEEAAAFIATIPMRRAGDCEVDIGRAVATICGPSFGFVTGQTIALDGGQAFLR